MKFCPLCANCLLVEEWEKGYKYFCNICDYHYPIHKKIKNKLIFETKKAEDILGGKKAWENVDQTEEICDKCGNNRAYFLMVQTRSLDEPTTIFYKCTQCGKQWSKY